MGILEQIGFVTTRALLAFIVFTFGTLAASAVKRIVKISLKRINANQAIALLKYPYDIEHIAGALSFYLVYIITALITFWLLGIASIVAGLILLLLAILSVLTAASFSKDLLPNLYGSYQLKTKKMIILFNSWTFTMILLQVVSKAYLRSMKRRLRQFDYSSTYIYAE